MYKLFDALRTKSYNIWVREYREDGHVYEKQLRFLDDVEIDWTTREIKCRIATCMKPFLLQLKTSPYYKQSLLPVSKFSSQYVLTFYGLLSSRKFWKCKEFEMTLDELYQLLDITEDYYISEFKKFRAKVLNKIQNEINEYSEYNLWHEPLKNGRTVIGVRFHFEFKADLPDAAVPPSDADNNDTLDFEHLLELSELIGDE